MNALTRWERWNPFEEMDELQNRLASFLNRTSFGRSDQETMTVSEWAPLVDITEDDKEYLVKAELPEVKKEDLSVTVENGVLAIAGERKREKEEKSRRYHRIERSYGSFLRSFDIPDDADPAKVNAEFKDGLLRVHIAKGEHAQPKAIDVKIA